MSTTTTGRKLLADLEKRVKELEWEIAQLKGYRIVGLVDDDRPARQAEEEKR